MDYMMNILNAVPYAFSFAMVCLIARDPISMIFFCFLSSGAYDSSLRYGWGTDVALEAVNTIYYIGTWWICVITLGPRVVSAIIFDD